METIFKCEKCGQRIYLDTDNPNSRVTIQDVYIPVCSCVTDDLEIVEGNLWDVTKQYRNSEDDIREIQRNIGFIDKLLKAVQEDNNNLKEALPDLINLCDEIRIRNFS